MTRHSMRLFQKLRARRGSALMLTLVFTFALGGLAISAIYMAGSTTILSKLYDRERDYRYAAEWALSIGKSRLITDTTFVLPDSLYTQMLTGATVTDATGQPVPKVRVDLYAGVGGASTGQYGRYVELVAVAYDNGGARHVRRLELQAENFARYAMFVDNFPAGICYATGEIVRGRAHSNVNWYSCGPPGPTYTDTVSAFGSVNGVAQYQSASMPNFGKIAFPSVSKLSWMAGYAASANLSFTPLAYSGTTGGSRMEFVAVDLDGDSALTGPAEGYFRVFDARAGATANPYNTGTNVSPFVTGGTDSAFTRAGTPSGATISSLLNAGAVSVNKSVAMNQCGVNYQLGNPLRDQFIPMAVHDTLDQRYKWFIDSLVTPVAGTPVRFATRALAVAWLRRVQTDAGGARDSLLRASKWPASSGGRCYPAGDPHLMPVERPGGLVAFPAGVGQTVDSLPRASRRGGEDTTFTWRTKTGTWRQWPGWTGTSFFTGATRRQAAEERYLWPVHRTQNLNSQGVIYANGDIWLSGQFRGRVTLYVSGKAKFVDDLTYVTNPASLPICQNLLGIITGSDLMVTDNNINRPRLITVAPATFLDDNQDFFLHAVTLSGVSNVNATFGVEAFGTGPSASRLCTPVTGFSAQTSGGCINQAGGVIMRLGTATFAGNYTGFAENRVKDACLDVDSPPYFPLTGRYLDNEFYEIDPAQFNTMGVAQFFRRLQSGT